MNNEYAKPANQTTLDVALLLVRIVIGVILAAHGSQKVFGWFGGHGLEATAEGMAGMGISKPVAYMVAIGECFGGLGLVVGLLTRFSAAANIAIMVGAIAMVHGKNGFFYGRDPKAFGYEYNLALIGLCLPILLLGPGNFSIGRYLPFPKSAKTGRAITILE